VHRLVQAVTRDQLDKDQIAAWSGRVLSLVAAVFPDEQDDHQFWPVCARVTSHVEAVAAHTGGYADLALCRGRPWDFRPGLYARVDFLPCRDSLLMPGPKYLGPSLGLNNRQCALPKLGIMALL
jgi:hypothetical protein